MREYMPYIKTKRGVYNNMRSVGTMEEALTKNGHGTTTSQAHGLTSVGTITRTLGGIR